ncbi:TrmH family RNA methyltransferase [Candidatus Neomarinimicrobiota bacterium]
MSLTHRDLKDLRALSHKKQRFSQGRFLIEGMRLVRDALLSSADIEQVLVSDKFAAGSAWPDLEHQARATSAAIVPITEIQARQLGDTRTPQGIFAAIKMPAVLNQPAPILAPPVLILDDITDPGNLGTILRTAEWFGVRTVLLTAASADVHNPKVVRGGMGAHFHLPVLWQGEPTKIAQALSDDELTVLGATMTGKPLDQLPPTEKGWALVIGSEAHGLGEFWSERLDLALTIPGFGAVESLNAAVAAGIILHYLQRDTQHSE